MFNLGVILLGALVRATGSGAGCGRSWPACEGEIIPEIEGATAVEFSHRAVSGVALILVVALFALVWRTTERGDLARGGAGLALAAIVGEALIGAMIVLSGWVADDDSAARAIAVPLHLVNTLLLLAALSLTIFWLNGGGRLDFKANPSATRWVVVGGVALALIAASGAVTALADTLFPDEPLAADFSRDSHFLTRLRIIHPILAVGAVLIGWFVGGRDALPRGRAVRSLPWFIVAMLVTGVLNVAWGAPVWMQIVHLALADGLWIGYVFASADALRVASAAIAAPEPTPPSIRGT